MAKSRRSVDQISVKILLSYLSILLVPLCAIIAIYSASTRTILDSQVEKNLYSLEKSAESTEMRLEEVRQLTMHIASDQRTNAIVNRSVHVPATDIYQIYSLVNSFPSYQLTNTMIGEVYIFFNKAGYTAKLPTAFPSTPYNYENLVRFHGLSYEQLEALQSTPDQMGSLLFTEDETGKNLLMVRSFPTPGTPQGIVVIDIQLAALRELLLQSDVGEGGVYLLSPDGVLVTHVGMEPSLLETLTLEQLAQPSSEVKLAGTDYVLCTASSSGGWRFVSLSPKSHLLQEVWYIRAVILALAVVSALIGALICLVLWRRRDRFYKRVSLETLRSGITPPDAKSEQGFLEGAIGSLVDVMGTMRTTLEQQKELLTASVQRKLLTGDYESFAALSGELEACGLELNTPRFYVLAVGLPDGRQDGLTSQQMLPYRYYVKQLLDAALSCSHLFCDMDNECFAAILLCDEDYSSAQAREQLERVADQLPPTDRRSTVFALSAYCGDPAEIAGRYAQTLQLREYMAYRDLGGVIAAEELPLGGDAFHFQLQEELQLVQLVRTGSGEETQRFLEELYRENLERRSLSLPMLRDFAESLRSSLLRLLREEAEKGGEGGLDVAALLPALERAASVREMLELAREANRLLSRMLQEESGRQEDKLRGEVEDIVEERFSDPAFNLYVISEQTGIPESTLYKNFKSYFGVTFSEYLERRRIKEACNLLGKQVPVKDVAELVGYTSDHTFRRAFKRIVKVLPSQYAAEHIPSPANK